MSGRATQAQQLHMNRVAQLGCVVCGNPATIHHCGTYMGGGRNHWKVIPLCWEHHLGAEGIDGKQMGKRVWEAKYGSEKQHLEYVSATLNRLYPQDYQFHELTSS